AFRPAGRTIFNQCNLELLQVRASLNQADIRIFSMSGAMERGCRVGVYATKLLAMYKIRLEGSESLEEIDGFAPLALVPEEVLRTLDIGPNMTHLLVEQSEGVYVTEDLVNAEVIKSASPSDLTYYFYNKGIPSTPVDVKYDNIEPLRKYFRAAKDTVFIIHGWKNSYQSDVNVLIKRAILAHYDVNLIVVDWSVIASRNYVSAKWAVTEVGKFVSDFIKALESKFGMQISKVRMAGHSLGAHVSGNAGAALQGQVDHIVGMDPALPLFSLSDKTNRLDPSDAKFVQVMHTCGGWLGFQAPIGHSDYYPNGGTSQTGCGLDVTGTCVRILGHTIYYAESIAPISKNFVAKQCTTYRDYQAGQCDNNPRSLMGSYDIDKKVSGLYYLNTNKESPFAQG
ncbi:hypothetical protein NQ317_017999, partial [Molorchus minor]